VLSTKSVKPGKNHTDFVTDDLSMNAKRSSFVSVPSMAEHCLPYGRQYQFASSPQDRCHKLTSDSVTDTLGGEKQAILARKASDVLANK
jgi:hypothetical protein